ncbi:MAG: CBS domain-containing protein [Hyphomicrobiaceae bacterium]|nr:CBS domain-containing protein [Hyphomicrobiaceae bacterium]
MTNRKLALIVKEQTPIVLGAGETVREASRLMWEQQVGSVLVVDERSHLIGIFTGRDAVKVLAHGRDAAATELRDVMTRDPATIEPDKRAVDALRMMGEGGFRHLPVVEGGRILGIVSRGDFKGVELDRVDIEQHLWETIW